MASVIKKINICNFQGSFEPIFLRLVFHSLLDTIVCGNPCYYLLLTIISIQVNPRSYKVEVITYCLKRLSSEKYSRDDFLTNKKHIATISFSVFKSYIDARKEVFHEEEDFINFSG